MGLRYVAIANPAAAQGRGRAIAERFAQLAAAADMTLELHLTNSPGHAQELAKANAESADVVVALGGDGTVHEVANGLLGITDTPAALAVVPTGTGNDFVRALGIPHDLHGAFEVLRRGDHGRIDVAHVVGKHYFVNNLAVGYSAQVVHAMAKPSVLRRLLGGHGAYLAFGLSKLMHSEACVCVDVDGENYDGPLFTLEVLNGAYCGGGISFAPEAKLDDGLLDVALYRPTGVVGTVAQMLAVQKAQAGEGDNIVRLRGQRVTITMDAPFPYHADGEDYSTERLEIELMANALRVVGF